MSKMKRILTRLGAAFTAAALTVLCAVPITASAATTAKLELSKNKIDIGDTVAVTITLASADDAIYTYETQLEYDDTMFSFVAAGSSDYVTNSNGGIVKIQGWADVAGEPVVLKINLKATGSGSAMFNLTNTALRAEDSTLLGTPTGYSDVLTVNAAAVTTPATTTATTPATTTTAKSTNKPATSPAKTAAQTTGQSVKASADSDTNDNSRFHNLALQIYIMLGIVAVIAGILLFVLLKKKSGGSKKKRPAARSSTARGKAPAKKRSTGSSGRNGKNSGSNRRR
ncbi:MAG: hypothetical protein QM689_10005 [Oscillospiraceae bacterium]